MNENLRELVFKAYTLCEKRTYGWLRNEEEFRQKFAEVIVRECIKQYNTDGCQTQWEDDQRVLKHFGVEE